MKSILSIFVFSLFSLFIYAQTSPRCQHQIGPSFLTTNDSIDVLHYDINLDIIYLSKKTIKGYTNLTITTKINGLSIINLDLLKLNVDSIKVQSQTISSWNYNDTIIDFALNNSIDIGDTILCSVYYHGLPVKDPSGWGGFYFSNDSSFAFNLGIGMQDNPHNYGRVWFPCVDDFVDRATYDFNIQVKNGKMAVCNGTLESSISGTNSTEYRWKLHDDIPAYLAAVAVGPYVAVRDTFNGINGAIPIAIYVKSNMVNQTIASFANLKQILTAFETYYGPYRWERIGYVGVPFGSGAMEHVTNIAIGLGYINGSLTYESLFAHELSHHWFGDLVTCSSAGDMWLNEGWAVFSESMYQEMVYGKEAYKDNMRGLLYDVLKNTHRSDGGYYALAGIPHNLTYGSTIYDKGGTVAHSVRGYLGDARFFNMLHAYMNQKAFSSQSSNEFRDFISSNTGINMDDFFAAWVDAPGFVHFAVDSFKTGSGINPPYNVEVWMRQRLNHKPNYANSNRVPISFMDNQWNRVDTVIEFSGETGSQTFNLAFKPSVVFCDLEERLADATTDYAKLISSTGQISLPLTFSKMDVAQASDSSLVQITHNWVAPDSTGINYPGLRISTRHFWTVNSLQSSNFDAAIFFHYYKGVDFDNDIIKNKDDSLVLLYRPHGSIAWQRTSFTKQGNWIAGYMKVDHLKNGDYVLAAYDYHYLGLNDSQLISDDFSFKISPNPSSDEFHFEMNDEFPASILIYDSVGKQITKLKMNALYINHSEVNWKPKGLAAGNYIVVLVSEKGRQLYQTKLIISK